MIAAHAIDSTAIIAGLVEANLAAAAAESQTTAQPDQTVTAPPDTGQLWPKPSGPGDTGDVPLSSS